jgi:cell division septum initiation protein DivIVA
MSANREFISSARKFAAQFKGLLTIADELEHVESIEQMAREAEARLAILREQEAGVTDAVAKSYALADREIAAMHRDANREIEDKRRSAGDVIDDAHDQAGRILGAARDEAAGFAQQAEAHRKLIEEHRQELARIKADIAAHEDFRDQAREDANAIKEQHDKEREALRAFRASLPQ